MGQFGQIKQLLLGSYIPVIAINGAITPQTTQIVRNGIKKIDISRAKAIAVLINSPGGSPTQCDIIQHLIGGFAKQHHLPVYTFADDLAASGGQFLLSIGDKQYVDKNSLVGSIGVVGNWFGIQKFLQNKGIQAQTLSSNENQIWAQIDIFSDLKPESKEKLLNQLKKIHTLFIQQIENNCRIKVPQDQREEQLYNAQVFLGKEAVEKGLADQIGNYQTILKKEFPQAKLKFVTEASPYQKVKDYFRIEMDTKTEFSNILKTI